MSLHVRSLALFCSLSLASSLACGGDDDESTTATTGSTGTSSGAPTDPTTTGASTTGEGSTGEGTTGGELKLGNIVVEVQYAGEMTGKLSIAAFTSFPPMGPPLASYVEEMPTFPVTGTLKGLEPKDYYVVAVLDVGNDSPQTPGPEDLLTVTAMPITIVGDDMPMLSLTLEDL